MRRQRRLMNQINVVPYIDVMLVLLVIFMVTAPLIQVASNVPSVGQASQTPAQPLRGDREGRPELAFRATPTRQARRLAR
jgi:biopolymer transport protein TolR